MTSPAMTQAEFARYRGVSRKTATIWKQKGLLVFRPDGSVDVAASNAALNDHGITPKPGNFGKQGNNGQPGAPVGFEALDDLDDLFDQGAMAMALSLVYRVGQIAASLAVHAGASCQIAFQMKSEMTLALMIEVEEIGRKFGMANFVAEDDPECWNPDHIDEVDWHRLADLAGEPVDIEGWKAAMQAREAAELGETA